MTGPIKFPNILSYHKLATSTLYIYPREEKRGGEALGPTITTKHSEAKSFFKKLNKKRKEKTHNKNKSTKQRGEKTKTNTNSPSHYPKPS